MDTYIPELKNVQTNQDLQEINELKKYFIGNKYGNCYISQQLEDRNFDEVKKILKLENSTTDTEILRETAFKLGDPFYRNNLNIEDTVARGIFIEATDQLERLGENITDVVNACEWFV